MRQLIIWLNTIIKKKEKLRKWQRKITMLAAIVTFATTYALILPAITVEKDNTEEVAGMYLESVDGQDDRFEENSLNPSCAIIAADRKNAVTFSYADDDIRATAIFSTTEEIPEGTELVVNYVDPDSSEYADLRSRSVSLLEKESVYNITTCSFYDYALVCDNVDVTPKTGLVDIQILFQNNTVEHTNDIILAGRFERSADNADELVKLSADDMADTEEASVGSKDVLIDINSDDSPVAELADGIIMSFSLKGNDLAESESLVGILAGVVDEAAKNQSVETDAESPLANGSQDESSEESVPEEVSEETIAAPALKNLKAVGSDYTVILTYDGTSGIPDDAVLDVSEILQGTDEYNTYLDAARKAMGLTEEEALPKYAARFFDIKIMVGDQELKPKTGVSVEITYTEPLAEIPDNEVSAVHFANDASEAELVEANATGIQDDGTAAVEFMANSFSVYGVIYTVDFTYAVNGKTYEFSLPGGGFVSLTDLVEVLGIGRAADITVSEEANDAEQTDSNSDQVTDENSNENSALTLSRVDISDATKKFVADVVMAEFSTPSLVDVSRVDVSTTVGDIKECRGLECEYSAELTEEQIAEINVQTVEGSDWILISRKPFKSNETLTVTMKNSEVFTVKVTDEQLTKEVLTSAGEAYDVKVIYGEDAKIPEDAHLEVTEFEKDSDDYINARKAFLADKQAKGESVDLDHLGFAALDISILDKDDNEIEPAAQVKVDIKIKSLPGVDNLKKIEDQLSIQHHVKTDDGVIVDEVFNGKKDAAFDMQSNETVKEKKADATVNPEAFDEETYRREAEGQNLGAQNETTESNSVEGMFKTSSFSTFSVTWQEYEYGWNGGWRDRNATVHYGYLVGNDFVEFDDPPVPAGIEINPYEPYNPNPRHAYLIRDFEGYQYKTTYYRTTEAAGGKNVATGATPRVPDLVRDGTDSSDLWRWATPNNNGSIIASGSHIYVTYEPKSTPTIGGNPKVDSLVDPPNIPKILKDSVENGDGTNTLSLSIIGDTKQTTATKLADVIIVFDVSGSMNQDMDGNQTNDNSIRRITIAKNAVSGLADRLMGDNVTGQEARIRMGLVPFSTDVLEDKVIPLTGDKSVFDATNSNSALMQLTAGGATNWEDALEYANSMVVDSERATFIIFVTDGNPTVRNTRNAHDVMTDEDLNKLEDRYPNGEIYPGVYDDGSGYKTLYDTHYVFGSGATDVHSYNYNAAMDIATVITNPATNKNFYSIAISNDADKLGHFTTEAGGKKNYTATTSVELTDAFTDIANRLTAMFGWGDIQMTDGITDLTNTVEKSGLANVDEGTFRYWRAPAPANWKTMTDDERKAYERSLTESNGWTEWIPGADGKLDDGNRGKANPATYADGAVKWNLGSNYMLEKDVIYRVTFDCWPKQQALDILANLRNGKQFYDYASYLASNPDPVMSEEDAKAAGVIISDDEWRQIEKVGDSYKVRTNAPGARTTYKTAVEQGEYTGTTGNDHEPLIFQDVDPMPINSNKLKVLKEWAHGINAGHQASVVRFHLLVDGKYYMNNGTFADSLTDANRADAYVIEVGDYNGWHYDDIYIAPGIVRHGNVLETGHTYALEEFEAQGDDNYDFSYEFKTQYVRPMNVDASATSSDTVKYLVEVDAENPGTGEQHQWIKDAAAAGTAGAYASSDNGGTEYYIATGDGKGVLQATNHKTSELDITKWIERGEGAEDKTDAQLDQETFMYRVTLEVPAGANIDGITGYVYFEYPDGPNAPFKLYGYQPGETAFENDIARFGSEDDSKKIYRSWNTTNSLIKSSLLTVRADGTQVIAMDIPQSRKEVIRFTNLPTGTKYTIQEVYANKTKPAARNNSIEGTVPSTDPSNLAEQGYTITQIRSKTSNQTEGEAATVTSTDTVTGTISSPDTRYYNQFTNTLGKHADVKINVTKHLEGYAWNGERYYFKLAAGENDAGVETPMPLTGRNPIYVSNASGTDDKTYGFDKIRFVRAGTYHYTVTEVDADGNSLAGQIINGVKYDSVKNIVVTVTEENNKLTATVTGDDTTAQSEPGLVTSTTKMTNAQGAVKVKKINKNTNALIGGAEFELRKGSEKLYLQGNKVLTASEVREVIDVDTSVSLDSEEAKTKMQDAGITAAFTIGEQELQSLNFGVVYTLHEINPPPGYIISENDVTFKLVVNAQGAVSVELTGNNASQSIENNTIVISISNEPGAELPHTGGPGTNMFLLLGILLIGVAGAGLLMKKRIITT